MTLTPRTLQSRLVLLQMAPTILALVVSLAVIAFNDLRLFEEFLDRQYHSTARVIGLNCAAALEFDDPESATQVLASLSADPNILAVEIQTPDGAPFARYASGEFEDSRAMLIEEEIQAESEVVGFVRLTATTSEFQLFLASYGRAAAVTAFVVLGIALLLAFWLQRSITVPIHAMATTTRRVQDKGEYHHRVLGLEEREDELGHLAREINLMLDRIEADDRELQDAHDLLEDRVTERTVELRRTLDDQRQFVHVASHDLKTPLRAIANLSEFIREDLGADLAAECADHLDTIQARVIRMERLIEGLRRYIDLGRSSRELEEVNVEAVVKAVVVAVVSELPEGSADVSWSIDLPPLRTSPDRLEMVLVQLLENAIVHHGGPVASIEITATLEDEVPVFTIADDGPGIAPEFRDRVFEIFSTLEARDLHERIGLGLAIVKKLVVEREGRVEMKSAHPHGLEVRFWWPSVEQKTSATLTQAFETERIGLLTSLEGG